jgi:nickel-dependent lactate racemase
MNIPGISSAFNRNIMVYHWRAVINKNEQSEELADRMLAWNPSHWYKTDQ